MKKTLLLGIIAVMLVLLTGCGKEEHMTCTKNHTITGVEIINTTELTFKDDYVSKKHVTMESTFSDEETAEAFVKNYEDQEKYTVKRDGKKVSISYLESAEKTDINKKDTVLESMDAQGYTCK